MTGCNTTPKVDYPVVGPPPPRIPNAVQKQRTAAVELAAVETTGGLTDVAAEVNGQPIFESEVLERFQAAIDQARSQADQMTPAQRAQFEKMLDQQKQDKLAEMLPEYIEQTRLNQKLREKFGGEVVGKVEEQLEGPFADEITRLKTQTGAKTLHDLEEILHENKMSLASMKRNFKNRQMAAFYLSETWNEVEAVKRSDIVARYNADIAEYTQPADVKWQQLTISFAENNGKAGALRVLEQAIGDLQSGETFDLVIGRYSNGIMKDRAGTWDYVTRGSLSNEDLEQKLFTLGVSEISPPIKTDDAFVMVRVLDRRNERTTPLADVQDKLKAKIEEERREAKTVELLSELWREALITTVLDDSPAWQQTLNDRMSATPAGSDNGMRL